MEYINILGYKFHELTDLNQLQKELSEVCKTLDLQGTILLSTEGINLSLAGEQIKIDTFISSLQRYKYFSDIEFKKSTSHKMPFRKLRIRIKKEIITLGQTKINSNKKGAYLSPLKLNQWLKEGKDITLLDTRNHYEISAGTFKGAIHFNIRFFSEFPQAIEKATLNKTKPVVMFCTGGIRCEKASTVMLDQGYQEVYQLEGGILKYLEEFGNEYYKGGCFVFDTRNVIDGNLKETGLALCCRCNRLLTKAEQAESYFINHQACYDCAKSLVTNKEKKNYELQSAQCR